MSEAIEEINKRSTKIMGEDLLEYLSYLRSVDPSFHRGLELILSGKSAEEAIESTMTPEDANIALSSNCGEVSESSIMERIEESKLKEQGDDFISDVVNKFNEAESAINTTLESIVFPDSRPNLEDSKLDDM